MTKYHPVEEEPQWTPPDRTVSFRMWAIDQVLGAAKAGVWDIVGDRDATILQDAESLYQYITTGKVPTANDGSE